MIRKKETDNIYLMMGAIMKGNGKMIKWKVEVVYTILINKKHIKETS